LNKIYTEFQKKLHTFVFLFPVSMLMGINYNVTCRLHGYWSIPYTHVRSIWSNDATCTTQSLTSVKAGQVSYTRYVELRVCASPLSVHTEYQECCHRLYN